ncbi:MAG: DUF3987 domain-containing protein, partial [Methyloprofundus sp.]|nr:DUF3987 domain-containing protein [Methyloprofundus sp.]
MSFQPSHRSLLPQFDREMYSKFPHKTILSAVLSVEEKIGAPIALIMTSVLAAISLALQGQIRVQRPSPGVSPSHVGLYQLVIAESGERKSSVDELFLKPFNTFTQGYKKELTKQQIKYKLK